MLLVLEDIHKAFGPVQALRGVSLVVEPGTVHGLVGENGAGKSTLMKVLCGAYQPDAGRMLLEGRPFAPLSPLEGRLAGISMIYQELTLAPHLTVEQNVTLGLEARRLGWLHPQTAAVRAALIALGQEDMDPGTPVRALSIGKQQVVEIARALVTDARVVVMDEPTSSLARDDTEALFAVIRRLRAQGVAVIYISHFLEEVQEICDTYTVIRDGETISHGRVADTTLREIIEDMVGRSVDELFPAPRHRVGEPLLTVEGLSGPRHLPHDVSFTLHRGEILGVSGLVGAGRSEMVRALFGLEQAVDGTVTVRGRPELKAAYLSPQAALRHGMDLLSENRNEEGLALKLSILANLTLSALGRYSRRGLLNLGEERRQGATWVEKLGIRCQNPQQPADTLSGGNQQKVCVARLLHHDSDVLFLDEPTRGIDIGSKAEIYRLIHRLAEQGKAVVMVSSYLPELVGMCDTLAVMHKGRLSPARPAATWSEQEIMRYATSGA